MCSVIRIMGITMQFVITESEICWSEVPIKNSILDCISLHVQFGDNDARKRHWYHSRCRPSFFPFFAFPSSFLFSSFLEHFFLKHIFFSKEQNWAEFRIPEIRKWNHWHSPVLPSPILELESSIVEFPSRSSWSSWISSSEFGWNFGILFENSKTATFVGVTIDLMPEQYGVWIVISAAGPHLIRSPFRSYLWSPWWK